MATVKIPTQLRAATDGEATANVQGSTVGEVLDALYDRYGELRSRIAEDGGLRRFVNVYVGGEDIRFLEGLDTPVADGDEVTIRGFCERAGCARIGFGSCSGVVQSARAHWAA